MGSLKFTPLVTVGQYITIGTPYQVTAVELRRDAPGYDFYIVKLEDTRHRTLTMRIDQPIEEVSDEQEQ